MQIRRINKENNTPCIEHVLYARVRSPEKTPNIIGWELPPPVKKQEKQLALSTMTGTATADTTGTGNRSHSVTPAVSDLLVAVCWVANNTNTTPSCTDDQSGTYTRIGARTRTISSVNYTLSVFVRDAFCSSATAHVITVNTGTNDAGVVGAVRVTNMSKVGAAAVLQSNFADGASGVGAVATYATTPRIQSPHIFGVGSADTAIVHPNGYTEQFEVNTTTPTTALECATLASGKTLLTTTSSTLGTDWACFALELDAAATQVTRRAGTTSGQTTGTGNRTIALAMEVGDLPVVSAAYGNAVWGGGSPADGDCTDDAGGTYKLVGSNSIAGGTAGYLVVWVRTARIASAATVTITIATTSNDGAIVNVGAWLGPAGSVGLAAIRQISFNTGASATTPTVTFGSTYDAPNAVQGIVGTFGFSGIFAPTGYAETNDSSISLPTLAYESVICTDTAQSGDTVTWNAAVATQWTAAIIEFQESVAVDETVSLTEAIGILKTAVASLSETDGLVESVATMGAFQNVLAETVGLSESLTAFLVYTAAISESAIAVSESLASLYHAIVSVSENNNPWAEAISAVLSGTSIFLDETVALTEALSAFIPYSTSLSETVSFAEQMTALSAAIIAIGETVSISEAAAVVKKATQGLPELVTYTEALASSIATSYELVDAAITLDDALAAFKVNVVALAEGAISATDNLSVTYNAVCNLVDAAVLNEQAIAGGTYPAVLAETVPWSAAIVASAYMLNMLADTISVADSLVANAGFVQALAENINFIETLVGYINITTPLNEAIVVTDAIVALASRFVQIAENVQLIDSATFSAGMLNAVTDTVALLESLAAVQGTNALLSETVTGLADAVSSRLGAVVNISEAVVWLIGLQTVMSTSATIGDAITLLETVGINAVKVVNINDNLSTLSETLGVRAAFRQQFFPALFLNESITATSDGTLPAPSKLLGTLTEDNHPTVSSFDEVSEYSSMSTLVDTDSLNGTLEDV